MSERKPLSHAERGRLGGLARADKYTKDELALFGAPGGQRTAELYGRAHFARLAFRRHGRLREITAPKSRKEGNP